MAKIEKTFYVDEVMVSEWNSSRFTTMAEAENYARTQAFKTGADHAIFKMISKAEKPQIVNDVKITAVQ